MSCASTRCFANPVPFPLGPREIARGDGRRKPPHSCRRAEKTMSPSCMQGVSRRQFPVLPAPGQHPDEEAPPWAAAGMPHRCRRAARGGAARGERRPLDHGPPGRRTRSAARSRTDHEPRTRRLRSPFAAPGLGTQRLRCGEPAVAIARASAWRHEAALDGERSALGDRGRPGWRNGIGSASTGRIGMGPLVTGRTGADGALFPEIRPGRDGSRGRCGQALRAGPAPSTGPQLVAARVSDGRQRRGPTSPERTRCITSV